MNDLGSPACARCGRHHFRVIIHRGCLHIAQYFAIYRARSSMGRIGMHSKGMWIRSLNSSATWANDARWSMISRYFPRRF